MFLLFKAKTCLKKKMSSDSVIIYFSDLLYPKEFWHYVYSPTYLLRLFGKYQNRQLLLIFYISTSYSIVKL